MRITALVVALTLLAGLVGYSHMKDGSSQVIRPGGMAQVHSL